MSPARAPRPVRSRTEATAPPTAAPPSTTPQETVCLPLEINRYRVLFADGCLVDFLAARDTSDIRGQMLDQHYGKRPKTGPRSGHEDPTYRIEGIAYLGAEYVYTPIPQDQPAATAP